MRILCLILILANVLYFVWSQLIDVQVNALDRPPPRRAEPPPRIVLAREAPDQTPQQPAPEETEPATPRERSQPATPPATARVTPSADLSCTSIGPFAELAEASQAQAALRGAGFNPRQRLEQGELWVGYWVSVQDIATRDAADSAIEALNAGGIDDVYLMPGGEPDYTLSLGVFSDYQRAQRRADQVRAVGLDPQIEDRKRAGSVYWLDVDLPEPGQMIDTSIFQSDPGKIMRLEMRACPESG